MRGGGVRGQLDSPRGLADVGAVEEQEEQGGKEGAAPLG